MERSKNLVKFLEPTRFIDADHESIREVVEALEMSSDPLRKRAVKMFDFVRDRIRYNPYSSMLNKEDYLVLAATIGADIALNKKILAGNEILKFIRRGELLSVAHLHGFDAEVVEIVAAPNSPITRKPLSKMDSYYYGKIMIGSIHRDGVWQVAVGDTHIQADERVIVVCMSPHLKDVQKLFLA